LINQGIVAEAIFFDEFCGFDLNTSLLADVFIADT
jgi:hypothetical protein